MRNRTWTRRGRPRGINYSRLDTRILEYIEELSAKRGIQRTEFFKAIVEASKKGNATCQELNIELRMKKNGRNVFLITQGHLVLAQFSIPEYILENANPFSGLRYLSDQTRQVFPFRERKEP